MSSPPTLIRAHSASREFEIGWENESPVRIPFRTLRWHCPCAMCVNEMTGERMIHWENVPADVAPLQLEPAGNYAVKITWSDGHNTGIYTWEKLRSLAVSRTLDSLDS